jgi:hypothetical protein
MVFQKQRSTYNKNIPMESSWSVKEECEMSHYDDGLLEDLGSSRESTGSMAGQKKKKKNIVIIIYINVQ